MKTKRNLSENNIVEGIDYLIKKYAPIWTERNLLLAEIMEDIISAIKRNECSVIFKTKDVVIREMIEKGGFKIESLGISMEDPDRPRYIASWSRELLELDVYSKYLRYRNSR